MPNDPGSPDSSFDALANLATPESPMDHLLGFVPRILASKLHIFFLLSLGVYLVVLPLLGVLVSAKAELIGGNYTNVTSDVGACIAAGGTLHLIHQARKRSRLEEERLNLTRQMHRLLFRVHAADAATLDAEAAE
ncbi:MAG: hypothetical protein ACYDHB_07685 [Candidatus Dormibacteria bacterium]